MAATIQELIDVLRWALQREYDKIEAAQLEIEQLKHSLLESGVDPSTLQ
jgi:hypothetical protein